MPFVTERAVPVVYKGIQLDGQYRLDLLVSGVVVVEIKAVSDLLPIHQAQLLTYLRLAGLPVGLLINFNVSKLATGVKRVFNPQAMEASARPRA